MEIKNNGTYCRETWMGNRGGVKCPFCPIAYIKHRKYENMLTAEKLPEYAGGKTRRNTEIGKRRKSGKSRRAGAKMWRKGGQRKRNDA